MSYLVDGVKVLSTVASGGKFYAQGDSQTAAIAWGAAGTQAGVIYLKNTNAFGQASKDGFKSGAWILDQAIAVLTLVELLFGLGSPNTGSGFKEAAKDVVRVIDDLTNAAPDATWTGAGSDAYAAANTVHVGLVTKLKNADAIMAAALSNEAAQIMDSRRQLLMWKSGLIAAIPVAVALRFIPTNGDVVSTLFQLTLAIAALGQALSIIESKVRGSSANARIMGDAISAYRSVSATASSNV